MMEFFQAAFPWVIMGLALAISITYMSTKSSENHQKIK